MRIKKIAAGNGPFFRKKLGPVVNVVAPPLQLSKFKYQSYSFLCKMFLEKNEKKSKNLWLSQIKRGETKWSKKL